MNRKSYILIVVFLFLTTFLFGKLCCAQNSKFDVSFIVTSDLHFDEPPEDHEFLHVQAINRVDGYFKYPDMLDGKETNFEGVDDLISNIRGVIISGDITNKAHPLALDFFKMRYEKGKGKKQINYDCYIGLGNHDLHPLNPLIDGEDLKRRNMMLQYVDARHKGKKAPAPVTNYDELSRNYSWDWDGVHLIQGQLYPGNTTFGQHSSLQWLEKDLATYASDGRPVVIFQHYGFIESGIEEFDGKQLEKYYNIISKYNIVGIFAGHHHVAANIKWRGIDVFHVNNVWHDSDGEASFAVVRITNKFVDVVTCKRTKEDRKLFLTGPFFSKKL
ncbi:metallophosphoesterase [Labilibaculum antarcticum]|nr:metallophosphoesterase [Labilibaculum antarcticum]